MAELPHFPSRQYCHFDERSDDHTVGHDCRGATFAILDSSPLRLDQNDMVGGLGRNDMVGGLDQNDMVGRLGRNDISWARSE